MAVFTIRLSHLLEPLGLVACTSFGTGDSAADASVSAADASDSAANVSDAGEAGAPAFLSVFVSSGTHIGQFPPLEGGSALTGFSGADAFCKSTADSSSIARLHGLNWVAWLSTSLGTNGDARSRLPRTESGSFVYEYRLTDGATPVFAKGSNVATTAPQNPIGLDENGKTLTDALVWTGTLDDGTVRASTECGGWNAKNPVMVTGVLGHSGRVKAWSADGNLPSDPCSTAHNVYCFQVP
jgi:hypothetical protein